MKKAVVGILKVVVPLGLGVWLVFYFYDQLDEGQRAELFDAFGRANWWWLLFSVLLGWCSHMSRSWRWRYLLNGMGYRPGFWNCYHATMSGYFMNLLVQRAGEASRAALLYRRERVPFAKGFGSIMAERAVDLILLLALFGITILLQFDKLDLFKERIEAFRQGQGPEEGGSPWGWVILGVLVAAFGIGAYLMATRPQVHARVMDTLRGLGEGLRSITRTSNPWGFVFHTFLIWILYVLMFAVGFYCLPATSTVSWAGIMAGFVAGAIGIVLVQGGIGVYPAFVALIVSVYMPSPEGGGLLRPEALAMGWLIWVAQTVMTIVVGGLSLLLISRSASAQEAALTEGTTP